MKTKATTIYRSITGIVIVGAVLLAASVAPAQNLFVGCYGGQTLTEIPMDGPNVVIATGLDYPTGLAFDKKGNLFESDQFSGNIFEFPVGSGPQITFRSGLNQPSQISFNEAGDMFVNMAGNIIYEYAHDGTEGVFASGFAQSSGLAVDKNGNVYVGNINGGGAGAGYITEVTRDGKQSVYASGLSYPAGLAFDYKGDLFVSGGNGFGTITKITPQGQQSVFASGLNQPAAMAFDRAGNLVVGDEGWNHEDGDITVFGRDGTKLSVNTSVSKPTSLAFECVPVPPR